MTKAEIHHAIIIGAGPAGLLASMHLSRAGVRHLLIDAAAMPRDKACADILTSKAIRELEVVAPELLASWAVDNDCMGIWGTKLHIEGRPTIDVPFKALNAQNDPSCIALPRQAMDHALWNIQLKDPLADLMDNSRVKQHDYSGGVHSLRLADGRMLHSRACISATGSGRTNYLSFAYSSHSERHTALGIRRYYSDLSLPDSGRCHLFLTEKWMPGGFYIAPVGDNLYNVNMVIRKDKVKRDALALQSTMNEAIEELPVLSAIFKTAVAQGAAIGAPLELATVDRPYVINNVLMAGDAAGLIDLVSANGIPQAMISGRLAAQAVVSLLAGGAPEAINESYSQSLKAAIASDVKVGRKLSPLLSYPWFCRTVLSGMGFLASSAVNEAGLERFLYSETPYNELLKSLNPLRKKSTLSAS